MSICHAQLVLPLSHSSLQPFSLSHVARYCPEARRAKGNPTMHHSALCWNPHVNGESCSVMIVTADVALPAPYASSAGLDGSCGFQFVGVHPIPFSPFHFIYSIPFRSPPSVQFHSILSIPFLANHSFISIAFIEG